MVINQYWAAMAGWFGFGRNALSETEGEQRKEPALVLVDGVSNVQVDGALQIATVWSCIERRANAVAALPFFAYKTDSNGQKVLARTSRLYGLLHDSPNSRMTPVDFWRAMMVNHDLRGNAYARIDRDPATGEAIALWPMPADQVEQVVLDDGEVIYAYRIEDDLAILAEANVLHLRNLGNGTSGFKKLEFMRSTTDESAKAQESASKIFGNGGKPTGVLMVDSVLKPEQRAKIKESFGEMSQGSSTGRLFVLEAKMDYKQLSISPEDQQLLETRMFNVEELCRWFDVPPVLVHHSNVTTWGSGVDAILDGWYKLSVRPLLVSIEQAVTKRVLTPAQRARMSVELSFDALLRGNATARADLYSKNVQNGIMTRNECRQLENLPPMAGADQLTAQSNLLPLDKLGQTPAPAASAAPAPAAPVLQSYRPDNVEAKARHDELVQILRAVADKPPQAVTLTNSFAEAVVHVTRNETIQPPVVNVSNFVNPTPVDVTVTNEVNPTPVDVQATFEATIQPATVELTMPSRKTEGTVTRNDKGEIVSTTTIERSI